MNVASLENCKELHELSGWWSTFCNYYWDAEPVTTDSAIVRPAYLGVEPRENQLPAYDLGYLLRKLPRHVTKKRNYHLTLMNGNENDDNWVADYFSLTGDAWYSVDVLKLEAKLTESDTPEDALCLLSIELFKQGILPSEHPTPRKLAQEPPMQSKQATWQGKNVNDMTKAELITALIEIGQLYEQVCIQHSQDLTKIASWKPKPWWRIK